MDLKTVAYSGGGRIHFYIKFLIQMFGSGRARRINFCTQVSNIQSDFSFPDPDSYIGGHSGSRPHASQTFCLALKRYCLCQLTNELYLDPIFIFIHGNVFCDLKMDPDSDLVFVLYLYIIRCSADENCVGSVVPLEPLNMKADWQCTKCQAVVPGVDIRWALL